MKIRLIKHVLNVEPESRLIRLTLSVASATMPDQVQVDYLDAAEAKALAAALVHMAEALPTKS